MRQMRRAYGDLAPGSGSALAPIESLEGIITPSGLHNIRSDSGTPDIDPKEHQLLLHGLVQRPLKFSMEALWSYPMTTRTHFVECSGNSAAALAPQPAQVPAGAMHGNIACSEWTGVPLRMLLEEAGLLPQARWLLAEGADSAHMSRSIPVEKALDGEERPKALVRFRLPWEWTGREAVLQSRATDEKGRRQPVRKAWLAQYSPAMVYHNNSIVSWAVGADGSVKNVYV